MFRIAPHFQETRTERCCPRYRIGKRVATSSWVTLSACYKRFEGCESYEGRASTDFVIVPPSWSDKRGASDFPFIQSVVASSQYQIEKQALKKYDTQPSISPRSRSSNTTLDGAIRFHHLLLRLHYHHISQGQLTDG